MSPMTLLRTTLATAALAFCACLAFANPIRASGTTLIVNEVPVFIVRTTYSGVGPAERAGVMAQRLRGSSGPIQVVRPRRSSTAKLVRGGATIAIVSPQEARAHGSSVTGLANSWASKIGSALSLPPIHLGESYVRYPRQTTKVVKMVGSKAWQANAASSNPAVATAKRTEQGLEVKTGALGQATITVVSGDARQTLVVEVWPDAANFPQNIDAAVTGFPANPETVRGALEAAVRTQFQGARDAKWTFTLPPTDSLDVGNVRTVPVRVHAIAPNSFPAEGIVNVNVRNVPVQRKPEDELWYCNDPESVKKPGHLFAAPLNADLSARLLYHHVNEATQALFLRIQVVNETDKPARVLIIPGDSKPVRDPVLAGLMAGDQFVRSWLHGSGEIVVIPPKSTMPISLRRMSPGETASGLCSLRLLAGGPGTILVRADAIPPFNLEGKWVEVVSSSTPWRIAGTPSIMNYDKAPHKISNHIYPNPYKEEELSYQVGGRYGTVRIGQRPIARADQVRGLDGNFGVVYTIKANVENKTNISADLELVFEASAGYSGGLFVVNGQYQKAHPMPPKAERQLVRFRLDPGGTKQFTIMTVPLSGSSYPATLTIRPVQNPTIMNTSGSVNRE